MISYVSADTFPVWSLTEDSLALERRKEQNPADTRHLPRCV
jgi:hypothetical protein